MFNKVASSDPAQVEVEVDIESPVNWALVGTGCLSVVMGVACIIEGTWSHPGARRLKKFVAAAMEAM